MMSMLHNLLEVYLSNAVYRGQKTPNFVDTSLTPEEMAIATCIIVAIVIYLTYKVIKGMKK